MKIPIIFLLFLIIASCSGNDKPAVKEERAFHEWDKGDSIFYFKDFDWYHFRGIDPLTPPNISRPFVKMIYKGDSLLLKVRYQNDKENEIHFRKLQGRWCKRDKHYYDGDYLYSYVFNIDTAMLELEFAGNPYDSLKGSDASLRMFRLEYPDGDTVREIICKSFYNKELKGMPDIANIKSDFYISSANKFFDSKRYVKGDSLLSGYIVYSDKGKGKERDGDWNWHAEKIYFNSVFLTKFLWERDMESSASNKSRADIIIQELRKYIK